MPVLACTTTWSKESMARGSAGLMSGNDAAQALLYLARILLSCRTYHSATTEIGGLGAGVLRPCESDTESARPDALHDQQVSWLVGIASRRLPRLGPSGIDGDKHPVTVARQHGISTRFPIIPKLPSRAHKGH